MSAKHTPGPWKINRNSVVPRVYGTDDNLIAEIHPHRKRDSHLIAAAPEMLEALKLLLRVPETLTTTDHFDYMSNAERIARAAIAKAEGRAK